MEIFSSRAIEFVLSLIFLNVLQLASVQNLKVCALVHWTLETSTWAETAIGIINKNKTGKAGRKNLIPDIVVTPFFTLVHILLQWSATLQLKHVIYYNYNAITPDIRERHVPFDVRQCWVGREARMKTILQ